MGGQWTRLQAKLSCQWRGHLLLITTDQQAQAKSHPSLYWKTEAKVEELIGESRPSTPFLGLSFFAPSVNRCSPFLLLSPSTFVSSQCLCVCAVCVFCERFVFLSIFFPFFILHLLLHLKILPNKHRQSAHTYSSICCHCIFAADANVNTTCFTIAISIFYFSFCFLPLFSRLTRQGREREPRNRKGKQHQIQHHQIDFQSW